MKDAFRHYFRPTPSEFTNFWENALFSFDASVLLNIYGYSRETREQLILLLENYSRRIQLPHQFALEFARNRCSTIMKQVKNYHDAERELTQIKNKYLAPRRDHPYLSEPHLSNYDAILAALKKDREYLRALITEDPFLTRLLVVFEGKLGPAPTSDELPKLHEEAKERYASNIPPGYLDLKRKAAPEAYGDYIGWRQLMNISQKSSRDIILVTDDFKDDWWQSEGDLTIGPLPALLKEFADETGHELYIYNSDGFLRHAQSAGAITISEHVIAEVGERLASQREIRAEETLKAYPVGADELLKSDAPPESEKLTPDEL
jgi:hypothetical protein